MRRLAFVLLFLLLSVAFLGPAAGQEAPARLVGDVDYAYGQALTFSLTAAEPRVITALSLFIEAPDLPGVYVAEVPVEPAASVEVSHRIPLAAGGALPLAPASTVAYWWELQLADGDVVVGDKQTFLYEDDQFNWSRAMLDGVVVQWSGEDERLGALALTHVVDARARLQQVLPVIWPEPFRVYLYPTAGDMRVALRLTGRDWVEGHADPTLEALFVTAVNPRTADDDLGQSIPHELAHQWLYRALGPEASRLPRWLDEGLAIWAEPAPNGARDAALQVALAEDMTHPVADLCRDWPAEDGPAVVALAQSGALVAFIEQTFGAAALRDLITAYGDGLGCDAGVRRALGLSQLDLERRWLQTARPVPLWRRYLAANAAWLSLLAGGFVTGALLLRRPSRPAMNGGG